MCSTCSASLFCGLANEKRVSFPVDSSRQPNFVSIYNKLPTAVCSLSHGSIVMIASPQCSVYDFTWLVSHCVTVKPQEKKGNLAGITSFLRINGLHILQNRSQLKTYRHTTLFILSSAVTKTNGAQFFFFLRNIAGALLLHYSRKLWCSVHLQVFGY